MKAVAAAVLVLFVLIHLGAIGIILSDPGLLAVSAVIALLAMAHVVRKPFRPRLHLPVGRKTVSVAAAVLMITGAALVLFGFVVAHLCNANIDLFRLCAYPRSGDFVFHKIGPVLLLLGLIGSLAVRHLPRVSEGRDSCD